MWGRFGRKRTGRIESVWRRFGRLRTKREERAYGSTVGPGIGVVALLTIVSLAVWLLQRRARETTPLAPAPEEESVEQIATNLPSPFKSPEGEAEYMAAYEATLKLWPIPHEPMDITGRYGRTHLVATGPEGAPALVLLHMDFVSLTMWAANIADLSQDYRVYAIDLMGQPGKSVPDKPLRDRDDAVTWITEVLDGLKLERVTLAGASYGGWFTLNYAIRAPERLERIVLLSPGGSFLNERLRFYLYALPPMILPFLPQRLLFDRFMRSMTFEENLRDPLVHAINERVGHQMYLGFRHFRIWKYWQSQGIKPHVFPDEELGGMRVPTLLLIGQQEVLYDPKAALERARRLIPNFKGELIPRSSHEMTISKHEIVDRRILEFLKESPAHPQASGTNAYSGLQ